MNRLHTILVAFEVVVEGATGLGLILVPGFVARLLLGAELPEIGVVVGRVAGMTLVVVGARRLAGPAWWRQNFPACASSRL